VAGLVLPVAAELGSGLVLVGSIVVFSRFLFSVFLFSHCHCAMRIATPILLTS
jgi:hypothetical protein